MEVSGNNYFVVHDLTISKTKNYGIRKEMVLLRAEMQFKGYESFQEFEDMIKRDWEG